MGGGHGVARARMLTPLTLRMGLPALFIPPTLPGIQHYGDG